MRVLHSNDIFFFLYACVCVYACQVKLKGHEKIVQKKFIAIQTYVFCIAKRLFFEKNFIAIQTYVFCIAIYFFFASHVCVRTRVYVISKAK